MTKTITESALAGWSLTDRDCTGVTETKPANGVSFDVVAGANIVCTFTNVKDATVTVVKQATPEGPTVFDFAGTGSGIAADFDLIDDGTTANTRVFTLTAAQLGSKTITEGAESGWSLTDRDCTGVTETKPAGGVTFDVVAGANITCTFTNTKGATVTVVKQATPEASTELRLRGHRYGHRGGLRSDRRRHCGEHARLHADPGPVGREDDHGGRRGRLEADRPRLHRRDGDQAGQRRDVRRRRRGEHHLHVQQHA